jgi:hypothetical protein
MDTPVVIWCFTDGKIGHKNQTQGLINALARRTSIASHSIDVSMNAFHFLYFLFSGKFYRQLSELPVPHYLLAAGRKTQLPMLVAQWWFGGKSILLMRPYWPTRWFDMLMIPRHDTPKTQANIFLTDGAINKVTPSVNHNQAQGIILVGGPSKHYFWDSTVIIQQILTLVNITPEICWTLSNSRRTPEDFLAQLEVLSTQLKLVDYRQTDHSWLPQQLSSAGQIWVTPDSVSMLYEAMSSGATVACLELKEQDANNRIVKGIRGMIDKGMLTTFGQWQKTRYLTVSLSPLNEAQRAADWVLKQ